MQILRSVVAQCFRRGRSIGSLQSRYFTSTSRNTDSNGERLKVDDLLYGGFCILASCKFLDLGKMAYEMEVYEEMAAKQGKNVAFSVYISYFGRSKYTPVYFDDPKSSLLPSKAKTLLEIQTGGHQTESKS